MVQQAQLSVGSRSTLQIVKSTLKIHLEEMRRFYPNLRAALVTFGDKVNCIVLCFTTFVTSHVFVVVYFAKDKMTSLEE